MKYNYDVVVSFAGEDREYVKKIVKGLKKNGIKVFYDFDEQSVLWGKNLYQFLYKICKDDALFFVPFLSTNYVKKPWAIHELSAAQDRAFLEEDEYILPIVIDSIEIPGINITTGHIDVKKYSVNKICRMIIEKVYDKNCNDTLKEKRLYKRIKCAFTFLVDSFCMLSQTSKSIEFVIIPELVESFRDILYELKPRINVYIYEILLELTSRINIEDDDNLYMLDNKSIVVKQVSSKENLYRFLDMMDVFETSKYDSDFDFLRCMETINEKSDDNAYLKKAVESIPELVKNRIKRPLEEELAIGLLYLAMLQNESIDDSEIDNKKIAEILPFELIEEIRNSERINQEAFDKLVEIIDRDEP